MYRAARRGAPGTAAVADGRRDGLAAALLVVLRLRLHRRRDAPLRQQSRHLGCLLPVHPHDCGTWPGILLEAKPVEIGSITD